MALTVDTSLPGLPCVGQSGDAGTDTGADSTAGAFRDRIKTASSENSNSAVLDFHNKATGDRPHKCHLCSYSTVERFLLMSHIRAKHADEKLPKFD